MRGAVVTIYYNRGFCFVRGEDMLSRFVHATWVLDRKFDTLAEGTEVEFEPRDGERGPQAYDVRPVRVPNKGDQS